MNRFFRYFHFDDIIKRIQFYTKNYKLNPCLEEYFFILFNFIILLNTTNNTRKSSCIKFHFFYFHFFLIYMVFPLRIIIHFSIYTIDEIRNFLKTAIFHSLYETSKFLFLKPFAFYSFHPVFGFDRT